MLIVNQFHLRLKKEIKRGFIHKKIIIIELITLRRERIIKKRKL